MSETSTQIMDPVSTGESHDAWVKIDLSNLDQTGLKTAGKACDIYMLGYASASGQILQRDSTGKLTLAPPTASDLKLPSSKFKAGKKTVKLETSANLFVGGEVKFSGGQTTIQSIKAEVVCAKQTSSGIFRAFTNPTWADGNDAVVLDPVAVNQGTVSNVGSGTLPWRASAACHGARPARPHSPSLGSVQRNRSHDRDHCG